MPKACVWMGLIAFIGSISWIQPSDASPNTPSGMRQDVDPTKPTPSDFEERLEALMDVGNARLDEISKEALSENLTPLETKNRILEKTFVLLSQMEFYIASYGIHDLPTTLQELRKIRGIVESYMAESKAKRSKAD